MRHDIEEVREDDFGRKQVWSFTNPGCTEAPIEALRGRLGVDHDGTRVELSCTSSRGSKEHAADTLPPGSWLDKDAVEQRNTLDHSRRDRGNTDNVSGRILGDTDGT